MIHQIQIKYDALADRMLMQVSTRAGEAFSVWLTRRMVQRLWPHFAQLATRMALARSHPGSVVLPQAQAMVVDMVRSRPLPNADFTQHFKAHDVTRPLGAEPLLASEIELQLDARQGLRMQIREASGRHVDLQFNDELHAAVMRLLEQALLAADWALPEHTVQPAPGDAPQLLN